LRFLVFPSPRAGWRRPAEIVKFFHARKDPAEADSVRLKTVRIRHFRNLAVQELEVPPEGVAIVGENAQGKTNFLESIYYLETFRSFRGARDEEALAFGEDVFRVGAALQDDRGVVELSAAFQRQGKRKKVTVNGNEPDRFADAVGRVAAVVFSPADVSVVSEGPGERRRYLDILLSLNVAGYLVALQRFRQVLAQRNASLREGRTRAEVEAWNGALIESGAAVMQKRLHWVSDYCGAFSLCHEAVSGGQRARLGYEPSVRLHGASSAEDLQQAYQEALADSAHQERRLGVTAVGPHRDELAVHAEEGEEEWLDVRRFGSGGQRRTAAFALRIVEAQTIRAARRTEPLVLLDDLFAELDAGRSERVLEYIERQESGQVILTAPKESDIRFRSGSLPRWCIRKGRLSA
jgi:DNA replication and repair protein RecF